RWPENDGLSANSFNISYMIGASAIRRALASISSREMTYLPVYLHARSTVIVVLFGSTISTPASLPPSYGQGPGVCFALLSLFMSGLLFFKQLLCDQRHIYYKLLLHVG